MPASISALDRNLFDPSTISFRLDEALGSVVKHGSILDIETLLDAGAKIDGSHTPPILVAADTGDTEKVKIFLRRGAFVNAGVIGGTPSASRRFRLGTRALHRAVECGGHLEVVRLLLNAGANPNVTDCTGWTPLMTLCAADIDVDPGIVTALLEAGADPAISDAFAMLTAAAKGRDEVVSMLLSNRPDILNTLAKPGKVGVTALCMAAGSGKASTVSLLLSAGATQPASVVGGNSCPLRLAAETGHRGVIRVLLDQGLEAIGGADGIAASFSTAMLGGRARALHLLLGVDGEEKRAVWASSRVFMDAPLLHCAVSGGINLATISVLLAGGARETTRDDKGRLPRQVIGSWLEQGKRLHPLMKSGIARMLERGPAFRARSWLWPSAADAGSSSVLAHDGGDIKTSSVVPARSTADAKSETSLARPPNLGVVVRIFRPMGGKRLFTTTRSFARYCQKL